MTRKIKKMLQIIALILVIILLIYVTISKFYFKQDMVKIFGKGALVVVTGSMEPTIHIKEFIVISEQDNYEINDIVTYRNSDGDLVTHRIVEKSGNKIITRGDNNTVDDEQITIDEIEGKVILHSIVLGEIFLYWLKPIIAIIIMLICIGYIKDYAKKVKNNEKENA